MFSWQVLEKMWSVVYRSHPQYLVEVAIATVVFVYALLLLRRSMFSRSRGSIVGG
jgi:hypothetical protein